MSNVAMTIEQLVAEKARLEAELKVAREGQTQTLRNTFSVALSEFVNETDAKGNVVRNADGSAKTKPGKGGFKVTGLGSRFPVTLYPEQWEVLFSNMDKIRACYNDPSNKAKSEKLRRS